MPAETYIAAGSTYRKLTEWHVADGAVYRDLQEAYIADGSTWRLIFQKLLAPVLDTSLSNTASNVDAINTGNVATTVGDLLVCACFIAKTSNIANDIALLSGGWNELLRLGAGTQYEMLIIWRFASGATQAAAFNRSGGDAGFWVTSIVSISGMHPSAPIDVFNSTSGAGTAALLASLSPSVPSYLGVTFLGHAYNTALSLSGSGWSELGQVGIPVTATAAMIWGEKPNGSGASGNINFTMADSANYQGTQIIVAPP